MNSSTPPSVTISFKCEIMTICESVCNSPDPPLRGAAVFSLQLRYGSKQHCITARLALTAFKVLSGTEGEVESKQSVSDSDERLNKTMSSLSCCCRRKSTLTFFLQFSNRFLLLLLLFDITDVCLCCAYFQTSINMD